MTRPFIAERKQLAEPKCKFRQLSANEMQTRKWQRAIADFVNVHRPSKPDSLYTTEEIRLWLNAHQDALIVIVEKQPTWLLTTEIIVAAARVLPLTSDCCMAPDFNSSRIRPSTIARHQRFAKAVLISDVVSRQEHQFALCSAVSAALRHTTLPIYCDTTSALFQHAFIKRHGAIPIEHHPDKQDRRAVR
jgi:hypothetical protein